MRIRQKISHVRSASLPVFNEQTDSIMIRRTRTQDRLAPPFTSPKTESALSLSPEVAKASHGNNSKPFSAFFSQTNKGPHFSTGRIRTRSSKCSTWVFNT